MKTVQVSPYRQIKFGILAATAFFALACSKSEVRDDDGKTVSRDPSPKSEKTASSAEPEPPVDSRVEISGCYALDRRALKCWVDFQNPAVTPEIRLLVNRKREFVESSILLKVGEQQVQTTFEESARKTKIIIEVPVKPDSGSIRLTKKTSGSAWHEWRMTVVPLELSSAYVAVRSPLIVSPNEATLTTFRAAKTELSGLELADALSEERIALAELGRVQERRRVVHAAYKQATELESDVAKSLTVKYGALLISERLEQSVLAQVDADTLVAEVLATARTVHQLMSAHGDAKTKAFAHISLAKLDDANGRYLSALDEVAMALDLLQIAHLEPIRIQLHTLRIWALARLGRCDGDEASESANLIESSFPEPSLTSCERERRQNNLAWAGLLCSLSTARPPTHSNRDLLISALEGLQAKGKRCEEHNDHGALQTDVIENLAIFALNDGSTRAADYWLKRTAEMKYRTQEQQRWHRLLEAHQQMLLGEYSTGLTLLNSKSLRDTTGVLRYRLDLLRGQLYEHEAMTARALQLYRDAEAGFSAKDPQAQMRTIYPYEPLARTLSLLSDKGRARQAVSAFWRSTERNGSYEYVNDPESAKPVPQNLKESNPLVLLHPLIPRSLNERDPWLLICPQADDTADFLRIERPPYRFGAELRDVVSRCSKVSGRPAVVLAEYSDVSNHLLNTMDVWRPRR